jgi:hypothetical protein
MFLRVIELRRRGHIGLDAGMGSDLQTGRTEALHLLGDFRLARMNARTGKSQDMIKHSAGR